MKLGIFSLESEFWNRENFTPLEKLADQNASLVAIATLALLRLQFNCGLQTCILGSLAMRKIALISDGSQQEITDYQDLKEGAERELAMLAKWTLISSMLFHFVRGKVFGISINQLVVDSFKNGWATRFSNPFTLLRISFVSFVALPFSKEIIFRGFLQDRLDQTQEYLSKKTTWIKKPDQSDITISKVTQMLLFGALSMSFAQTPIMNAVVFGRATVTAYFLTEVKDEYGLVTAMLGHSIFSTIGIAGCILF